MMIIDTGQQLSYFLKLVAGTKGIYPSHISLYTAMLLCCRKNGCRNPFRVSRRELMRAAAIRSYATYHKCLNELIDHHLIRYTPSFHPREASLIEFLPASKKSSVLSGPANRLSP